jgi:hypothetical protein
MTFWRWLMVGIVLAGLMVKTSPGFCQFEEAWFSDGEIARRCDVRLIGEQPQRHGHCRRWYPAGTLAEEAEYVAGRMSGAYTSWLPSGGIRFRGRFQTDRLQGQWQGWFENGRPRFQADFEKGARTGTWIRYHEKITRQPVVKIGFCNNRLDGELWARIDRGSGSGRGFSYDLKAHFRAGRLTGPLRFSYTDPRGHTVILQGRVQPDDRVLYDLTRNVRVNRDGQLQVDLHGRRVHFENLSAFWLDQLNEHIMTTFDLSDCRHPQNLWNCRLPLRLNPSLP